MGFYGCIIGCMTIRIDTLKITPEILSLISELDEFKGAWRALGALAPERLNSLKHVATIESIGSSTRIEGSKLSDKQVSELLSNLEVKKFANRDEQEVAGYAQVMETIYANAEHIHLSENHIHIQQLHRDLLSHSTKDERHRGKYKTHPNHVNAFDPDGKEIGVVFQTASPFDTPHLMRELVEWTNQQLDEGKLHPLLVIGVFIVTFLEIHPFQDGNGRLSRVLTSLLLIRCSYKYVYYSSLESVIEHSIESYYLALRQTQGTIRTESPDWGPWLQYFLKALQGQKQMLERKVERERILLETLPELSARILELTREHGRLTTAQIVSLTGANRNTIKVHLKNLAQAELISQHGVGRGTWYGVH